MPGNDAEEKLFWLLFALWKLMSPFKEEFFLPLFVFDAITDMKNGNLASKAIL